MDITLKDIINYYQEGTLGEIKDEELESALSAVNSIAASIEHDELDPDVYYLIVGYETFLVEVRDGIVAELNSRKISE